MTIQEIFKQIRSKIGPEGDLLGAELLLAFVLSKSREYLLSHGDEDVSSGFLQRFYDLFDRMMAGEPVAYLVGRKEFFGLDFMVDKRVLIPRPETEHLVERVLDFSRSFPAEKLLRILDVGTGSGCIAVALAKHLPSARITAVDISEEALEVARMNAGHNGVQDRVTFLKSDLVQSADGDFDVIVANLPYIGEKRFGFVSKSATDYEPHVALFGGEDGLALYRKFFEQLSQKKMRPRLLAGEFGFLQKDELIKIFQQVFPEFTIRFEQDYAHIDRMFVVEFAPYV